MAIKKRTKTARLTSLKSIIQGVTKHLREDSLFINGRNYKRTALLQSIQEHVDEMVALDRDHKLWTARVKRLRSKFSSTIEPLVVGVEHLARARYGTSIKMLDDFGFKPPKKPVRTPEAKIIAAAKAKATRKARGTLGRRQRKSIHGVVTDVVLQMGANEPAE